MNDSSCVFDIIYKTLQINNNCLSVRRLCSIAGVSRSGYYAWIKAAPIREIGEFSFQVQDPRQSCGVLQQSIPVPFSTRELSSAGCLSGTLPSSISHAG